MTRTEVIEALKAKGYTCSEESSQPNRQITILWPVLIDKEWKNARMNSSLTFRNKAGQYLSGIERKEGYIEAGRVLRDLEREMFPE
mgnify:FL=1